MKDYLPAEHALLKYWHAYVSSYSPTSRQYTRDVHTISSRSRLYYMLTEELIEYFKQSGISDYTNRALRCMGVRSSTLSDWRAKWRREWLALHKSLRAKSDCSVCE